MTANSHQIETVLFLNPSLSSDTNELFLELDPRGYSGSIPGQIVLQSVISQTGDLDPATRSSSHSGDKVQKSVTTDIVFESQI